MPLLKVSIITPCFNSAKTILRTINSVNNQTHKDVEHIFVDGGSTDETLRIINENARAPRILSEKDQGIYDAMNKGFALATGAIVGVLNSDDWYASNSVLEIIVRSFTEDKINFYCAHIDYFDEQQRYSHDFGKEPTLLNNKNEMSLAHPSLYVRKKLLDEVGEFNLTYKIAADYEWCLRMLKKNYRYVYEPTVVVHMALGGASSKFNQQKLKEELRVKSVYFPGHSLGHLVYFGWRSLKDALKVLLGFIGLDSLIEKIRIVQGKRRT